MTVVKKHQLEDLKHVVHKIDENAFVIVSDTNEVLGKGFKDIEDKDDDRLHMNDNEIEDWIDSMDFDINDINWMVNKNIVINDER